MKTLLFTLTHCVSELLIAYLQNVQRAWPGDFLVLLDATHESSSAHLNPELWHKAGLRTRHMKPAFARCCTDRATTVPGGFDLIISFLAGALEHYSFFLFFENDVYLPAPIGRGLLSMLAARHDNATDVLALRVPFQQSDWHWFRSEDGCRQLPNCGATSSFIMPTTLFRLSARMAGGLVRYAETGRCGYREVLMPTVARDSNFSVRAWPRALVESHRMCGAHCPVGCPQDAGLVHPVKLCAAPAARSSSVGGVCSRLHESITNASLGT